MSDINISITLSLEMLNQLEKLAKIENKEINDFIIEELHETIRKRIKLKSVSKLSDDDLWNKAINM